MNISNGYADLLMRKAERFISVLSEDGKEYIEICVSSNTYPVNQEKWIPGSYVKIGYFETDSELRYQDEIHGSLISQADRVVDLIFNKYLKAEISYQGVTRVETYPFPKEAIREAVFNAIARKFYGTLIPIQIRVYADKIMIANDCVFPDDGRLMI